MDFSECLGTERLTKTYTRLGSLYQCTELTSYKIGDVACSLPLLKLFGKNPFHTLPQRLWWYTYINFPSCKRKMFSLTTKLTRINFKQTFYICQREKGPVCFEMKVHLLKWPSISRIIRNPSATFLDSFFKPW